MILPNMNNIDRGLACGRAGAACAWRHGPAGLVGGDRACPYRPRADRLVPGLSVIGHQYLRPPKHLTGFSRATANGSA